MDMLAFFIGAGLPFAALALLGSSYWWWSGGERLPAKDIAMLFFLLWLTATVTLPIFHAELTGQEESIRGVIYNFGALAVYVVIGRNWVLWRKAKAIEP